MTSALIGYSGFVGGAILRARSFDARFRSTDIDEIRGRQFDLVVCCGTPAEKWRANRDPAEDRARLATLTDALVDVRAERFVLISTIDVYPRPNDVNEDTPIDPSEAQPYGRHRYELEEFCRSHFETCVVRLPAMYGKGLKKNAIFDLMHDRPVDGLPGNACFQFYDVDHTWTDVERILAHGIHTANITAEPVSMTGVAQQVFGRTMSTPWSDTAPNYDARSLYADLAGGRRGYWYDAKTVIDGLVRFVAAERAR